MLVQIKIYVTKRTSGYFLSAANNRLPRENSQKSFIYVTYNMVYLNVNRQSTEIQNHPTISPGKKQFADWYAKLLVNNFLVTVRWWFSRKDDISPQQITAMMKRHMISGTIPTLKEQS